MLKCQETALSMLQSVLKDIEYAKRYLVYQNKKLHSQKAGAHN